MDHTLDSHASVDRLVHDDMADVLESPPCRPFRRVDAAHRRALREQDEGVDEAVEVFFRLCSTPSFTCEGHDAGEVFVCPF